MTKATTTTPTRTTTSVVRRLRSLVPRRTCDQGEALHVAEHQAARLVALLDPSGSGITEATLLAAIPRLQIVRADLPVSGTSHWNGRAWVICLNQADSLVRQRFTLVHELKHVLDHGHAGSLYRSVRQAEQAADFFAGCVLVSRRDLKAAWGSGIQDPELLAEHFGVSVVAIRTRLSQTGLSRISDQLPAPRCARPVSTPWAQWQRFTYATSDSSRSIHRAQRSYS